MKKLFALKDEKKHEDRVLEAIKHEVRKYIKREKKKKLPDSKLMYWDFDCKVGSSAEDAEPVAFDDLIKAIDAVKQSRAEAVYIEIHSKTQMKPLKEDAAITAEDAE